MFLRNHNLTLLSSSTISLSSPPSLKGFFFELKLVLSADFPNSPPRGFFLTKIYHPNVNNTSGDICVNTLKKDWTPSTTVSHVLSVIRCLLIVPFPESSLNDEAGKLFMDSYDEYARRAKLMAGIHAKRMSSSAPSSSPSTAPSSEGVVPAQTSAANNGSEGGCGEDAQRVTTEAQAGEDAAEGSAASDAGGGAAKADGAAKKSKEKGAEDDKKKAAKKKLMRL